MRNLQLAYRSLARTPFITAIAVLSLAFGIGANAGIFSLFDQMLLRPLPVRTPDQLVNLVAPGPKLGATSCNIAGGCDAVFSYPMFRDLQAAHTPFSGIAAHRSFDANLAYHNQTLNGEGMLVSGSYFPVLGLRPALGRLLGPDDDRTVGAEFVTVLSHGYWTSHLGGDPSVLGQSIVINGQAMTIVGVAPVGFAGTTLGSEPNVFVPLTMRGVMAPGIPARFVGYENRQSYWIYIFARLRPGVSLEQARTALNTVYHPIITDVEAPLQQGMSHGTMQLFRAKSVELEDGRRGQSSIHGEVRTPLTLLLAISGIVLLIACANIANLLLARGANRSMEMAVRVALGASRRQILAQLLTESCVMATFGGMASLLVAQWTLASVASILPPEAATSLHFEIDTGVVLFAGALSVGTGLLFGMFPALHSTRPNLATTIRANTGQLSGARTAARFRAALVTGQIALSMALLISAGLFVRSLVNVSRVDLGLEVDHVVTFRVSPQLNGYKGTRSRAFFQRTAEELAAVPGVTGVSASKVPIFSSSNSGNAVSVQGFQDGPDFDSSALYNEIGADYFRMLGIPLLAGREFSRNDIVGTPRVAIVNQAFAKKFDLGDDPIGKWMALGGSHSLDVQIVGLVRDAKYSEVKDEIPPLYFTPYAQDSTVGAVSFYVRTALPAEQIMRSIPSVIGKLDPNLPVEDLKTLSQQVRENVFMDRMVSTLSAAFAVLATLLAAIGLYGVLAYTVAQRTREIGVRIALGADARHVRGMVLRQVGRMMLVGGVIGIAAAIGIGHAARSLLFRVGGQDPVVIVIATMVLTAVALGAGYLPARRASRIDPIQALRYE